MSRTPLPPSFSAGPAIMVLGGVIVLVGLLVWSGALSWFGKLPGDIRYERDATRVYVPFASMFLVSLALSLVAYAVRRWF